VDPNVVADMQDFGAGPTARVHLPVIIVIIIIIIITVSNPCIHDAKIIPFLLGFACGFRRTQRKCMGTMGPG
jgi:hypothetical protein